MRFPHAMRWPVWPGVLAALAVVALLFVFHQVVSAAVHQAELRRVAAAAQAAAVWRCKARRMVC